MTMTVRMIGERVGAMTGEKTGETIVKTIVVETGNRIGVMIGMRIAIIANAIGMTTMMTGEVTGTMIVMTAMMIVMIIGTPTPAVSFEDWIEPIMWPASMAVKGERLPAPRSWIVLTGRNVWKGRITLIGRTEWIDLNGQRDPNGRTALIDQGATDEKQHTRSLNGEAGRHTHRWRPVLFYRGRLLNIRASIGRLTSELSRNVDGLQ